MTEIFSDNRAVFLLMVAIAVFLLAQSLMVPVFGAERQMVKRLRKRIGDVADAFDEQRTQSLLRQKYLQRLSPLERRLESLPGMDALGRIIEQCGLAFPAYRIVLACIALAAAAAYVALALTRMPLVAIGVAPVAAWLPVMMLNRQRVKRLMRIEEQLPEALDVMTRALRAGHPFTETLQMVAEEMDDPIARELGATFNDVNYGADVRTAFISLLDRVPSMALMTLVTSVLVQRETGGNLAEIIQNNSAVVRGRFRFQRKVRTLSAEGRLSAWVLAMVPFVLYVVISVTTPEYLPVLVQDPLGRQLIIAAFCLMIVGIFWMRKVIRIDV